MLDPDTVAELHAQRECVVADLPPERRPATARRGIHHTALISSDVRRTVEFYQGVLGFPLTDMFENRDYPGSTHFFFDVGNGNAIAFFDLPGLDLGPYAEVSAACTIARCPWSPLRGPRPRTGSTPPASPTSTSSGTWLYFRDPDGARLELISDPLGEMYGTKVV